MPDKPGRTFCTCSASRSASASDMPKRGSPVCRACAVPCKVDPSASREPAAGRRLAHGTPHPAPAGCAGRVRVPRMAVPTDLAERREVWPQRRRPRTRRWVSPDPIGSQGAVPRPGTRSGATGCVARCRRDALPKVRKGQEAYFAAEETQMRRVAAISRLSRCESAGNAWTCN